MKRLRHPTHVTAFLVLTYITLSMLQRLVFLIWFSKSAGIPARLPIAIVKGLAFDISAGAILFAPLLVWLLLVPRSQWRRAWFRGTAIFLAGTSLLLTTTASLGEFFFFDEFHARYNFIAVDYLIYTTEIAENVIESYSPVLLAAGFLIPFLSFAFLLNKLFKQLDPKVKLSRRQRSWTAAALLTALVCVMFVSEESLIASEPFWPRELSKNSLFTFFTAYKHNAISYNEFYAAMDSAKAIDLTRQSLHGKFVDNETPFRAVMANEAAKPWNVVMVVMESMSAGFLTHFGNRVAVTPNLDRLADQSLFFTNMYATGTRTVRGLEALMLSLPPTPGQSILRRPHSDGIFSLGNVFARHGYQTQFIYGGHAYFDNMQAWFESNGFQVVDRGDFPRSEIHFANAWGVCDEDLFDQVLKEQENIVSGNRRFFQVVLTTSNHRPYTFPEGRIDIPPHSGREGAIKYSDFAIGRFVEQIRSKPWFKNTLVIFVADHDASVAGGTDIPVADYLIPAIIYNPGLIPAQTVSKLSSQIDLAPTLLGILGMSYESKFFGEDLKAVSPERAFLGTYQKVALLQPGRLTVLAPGRSVETQELDTGFRVKKSSMRAAKSTAALTEAETQAIAVYQTASDMFTSGRLKSPSPEPTANAQTLGR